MSHLYPGAEQRPCTNQSGTMDAHLGLILHVQEGDNDLTGQFNNPNSQTSYTWDVLKDGTCIQFCDADARAWAQIDGNGDYNSVGTQGFTTEPLTEAACEAIGGIYRWGHDTYGWPYQLTDTPGVPGLGWHGMGCAFNWGHCTCPGEIRKNQRQHILDLAQGITTPSPVAPPQEPAPSGDLAEGSTGPAVVAVQRRLGIPADGIFGPQTDAAVRAFQQSHGLTVDGIVGPQTEAALNAPPAPPAPAPSGPPWPGRLIDVGASGDDVRQYQQRMADRGWSIAVDGSYGPQSRGVTVQFQAEKGLAQDGIVGPATWREAFRTDNVTA